MVGLNGVYTEGLRFRIRAWAFHPLRPRVWLGLRSRGLDFGGAVARVLGFEFGWREAVG